MYSSVIKLKNLYLPASLLQVYIVRTDFQVIADCKLLYLYYICGNDLKFCSQLGFHGIFCKETFFFIFNNIVVYYFY